MLIQHPVNNRQQRITGARAIVWNIFMVASRRQLIEFYFFTRLSSIRQASIAEARSLAFELSGKTVRNGFAFSAFVPSASSSDRTDSPTTKTEMVSSAWISRVVSI